MFLTLVAFLLVLSLIVFVHELGHFWTARKFGVKAEEFGFGFPPRFGGIYKKDGKWKFVRGAKEVTDADDTIYSINWIPLGGFVKIKGEDGENQTDPDSFAAQAIWKRAVILLAGVTMNMITAVVLASIGFMIGLPQVLGDEGAKAIVYDRQIQVVEVLADSPAKKADLKTGDIILSINGKDFSTGEELQEYTNESKQEDITYKIKRGQDELEKQVALEIIPETEKLGAGIAIAEVGLVRYPIHLALWHGFESVVNLTQTIVVAFYDLLKGLILGQGVQAEIAGPVGIAALTGRVAHMGFVYLLQFTVMLSVNLAIINAFPFPALDGGRLFFLIIEKIKGSPVKREVEAIVHNLGFVLLMGLVLLVTFKDVAKYGGAFKSLWGKILGLF